MGAREGGCVAVLARFDILDGFGVDNFMSAHRIYLMSGIRIFPLFAAFPLPLLFVNKFQSFNAEILLNLCGILKNVLHKREMKRERERGGSTWKLALYIKN